MDKLQMAEQFRRAVQLFIRSLTDEEAMEIATVYPKWEVGKKYTKPTIVSYGENSVGDPQLYRVEQEHTSQADWLPNKERALYTPIGLTDEGYPIWSQPTGANDCYNEGDIVDFEGVLYKSKVNGNVWSPLVAPDTWEVYEA